MVTPFRQQKRLRRSVKSRLKRTRPLILKIMTSAQTLSDGVCRSETKDIMPVAFEFKCVPFEGLKERPFKLRLSIITGDRPVLVLRIIQLEAVQEEWLTNFVICLLRNSKTASRNLHWYFQRLISLLQMPLRGHLWKHNRLNNRRMVRASFYQNSAWCSTYTWRTKCHLLKLFLGSIFIMTR
ncbi:DUF2303 family protein [Escherichia coli]|uniref:DUF2303 family protein n=1 Tax=Escherichia coli TaxID=562 RepID=UPI0039A6EE1C